MTAKNVLIRRISHPTVLQVFQYKNSVLRSYDFGVQQVLLAYQDTRWIELVSGLKPYILATYINLAVSTDNGRINSSPATSIAPIITVPVRILNSIKIFSEATNSSFVASTNIDEYSNTCQDLPGAQLYSSTNTDNNVTLIFNTSFVGYYIIAIQIEDFVSSAPNSSALSSVYLPISPKFQL